MVWRSWIPFWSHAKLIVTCWLVLPYFSGAAYVYEQYVRPFFLNPRSINIWHVPRKEDIFSKPDDILTAAEKYMQENGPEAFEKLISKVFHIVSGSLALQAEREAKSRGSNRTFYDDNY
ncbi:hypothetical protein RHGRI_034836 [Rhododendron griersonianum]|uniref:HVA22-like protein n=1 Tax=Rhododendron griersonianum TaxID=479676 RepID=A0AAV6I279_9ERIC|nr:hypothetical protein RHGRI_034836 [Rhododendron griersonianum]